MCSAVKGDDGLRNLGIDDAPHREMLSVLLQDADGDASNSRPDPDSIAGARDKMASEMEALRIKLQVKQQVRNCPCPTLNRKP